MEATAFACGICGEKFEKIVKFYVHLGDHNVLIQKEFHICNLEVPSQIEDVSQRVKNEGEKDSSTTTASYICKACSCTFATLCLLHNHLSGCFESGSYVFDAEHNTAHPIKSICSFFEGRNDIQDIADIGIDSDCSTVGYEPDQYPEELEDTVIKNEDRLYDDGRSTIALNDAVGLTEEPNGVNSTQIQCKQRNKKDGERIARESDAPKENVKQNIVVKTEKSKVKKQYSRIKLNELPPDAKSLIVYEDGREKTVYQCRNCDRVCKSIYRFKRHALIHTTERTHKCELCPRAYKQRYNLLEHMLSHSDELPFCCESCGERFPSKHLLSDHNIVKHVTERPHKCDQCGAAFKKRGGLSRHAMQHSERTYQCEICGMGFTRKNYLDNHRRTHGNKTAKRFACNLCDRRFDFNSQLQLHLKVQSGDHPFACKLCTMAFVQRKQLRKHMKTRHGLNLEDMDITGEEETDKAFQIGRIKTEFPGEIVEDGIVNANMENQSNVYEGMDTQSTDYQTEETQSTVI